MEKQPLSVKAVFDRALEIEPAAERKAYLDESCANAPELRQQVEALLVAYEDAGSFLEKPAPDLGATVDSRPGQPRDEENPAPESPNPPSDRDEPGRVIGPYKLLQQIGEGGMGTVFMAEQTHPVRRMVALKIIKAGMDSRQVIARFEAERQALALMDHPNIARVLDAGTTDAGRPYFVMELVKGVPITRYCDENRLTPRERLELFLSVCQAVQHAHQKGIIHRDIKPSNVMVCLYDDEPVPKVIDFGIAKATGQKLTERTMFTEFGAVVGTLEYMSPEQAGLNQMDIDTRSDIYSLGVLLYELLTGTTPLERKRLKEVAVLEWLRLIREEESPRPSTRLSSTEGLPSIAANRSLEPKSLSGQVRGELDWIALKALEKDRGRRYETANGFAADVQRYLADEPVQACPPAVGYKLRKFVRRNRGPVLAATLVLLALVGGTIGTSWQAVRATWAEKGAIAQRDEKETARALAVQAEQETKAQAEIARAVNEFLLTDLLGQADVGQQPVLDKNRERNPNVTVGELLDRAANAIEGKFADQPLTEAAIRQTLGQTYRALGRYVESQRHLERAVGLRTDKLGANHPDTMTSKLRLGILYKDQGKYDRAELLFQEVLDARTASVGADHPDTLTVKSNLGNLYGRQGKYDQAEKILKEELAARTAKMGADHPSTLTSKNYLAALYLDHGKYDQAEPLFKEVVAADTAQLGADHPATLSNKNNLALVYLNQRKYDQAEPLFREVIAVETAKQGADHPHTLITKCSLARLYQNQGKNDRAESLYLVVLAAQTTKLGADHPNTLITKNNLAAFYWRMGKLIKSVPMFEEMLRTRQETRGDDHPDTVRTAYNLAVNYLDAGRAADALKVMDKWLPRGQEKLGWDHPATQLGAQNALRIYERAGMLTKAESLYPIVIAAETAKLGADHPHVLIRKHNLAVLYLRLGKQTRAVPLLEELLRTRQKIRGDDHPETVRTAYQLAVSCRDAGRVADTLKVMDEWLPRGQEKLGRDHPVTQYGVQAALVLYERARTPAKAEPLLRELADFWKKKDGADSPRYAGQLAVLGLNLLLQKKAADAEPVLRECLALRQKKEPGVWTTFSTQSMLGESLSLQKKYADAEPLLAAGYEGMKQREAQIPSQGMDRLTEALERLVRLYEALGKQEKAAEWRKKLKQEQPE